MPNTCYLYATIDRFLIVKNRLVVNCPFAKDDLQELTDKAFSQELLVVDTCLSWAVPGLSCTASRRLVESAGKVLDPFNGKIVSLNKVLFQVEHMGCVDRLRTAAVYTES